VVLLCCRLVANSFSFSHVYSHNWISSLSASLSFAILELLGHRMPPTNSSPTSSPRKQGTCSDRSEEVHSPVRVSTW